MKINAYQRLVLHSLSSVLHLLTKSVSEYREVPEYLDDCVHNKRVEPDFEAKMAIIKENMEKIGGRINR